MESLGSEPVARYEIETLEQLRAIADQLRVRIIDYLVRKAMTVTQLGDALGLAPAKVHYHVRELERVGLVRLVETREKGGILEKYYRAVAEDIQVSKSLLNSAPPDETYAAISGFIGYITGDFLAALERDLRAGDTGTETLGIATATLWVTDDEARALNRQLADLLKPYGEPRGVAGERERSYVHLLFAPPPPSEGAPPVGSERTFLSGSSTCTRADLEQAVAADRPLDLFVLGACTFAPDVTPELVEQGIARFRPHGTVKASPEVRAALRRKERHAKKEE